MNVTVTDACIFIDLLECEACDSFFKLPIEITTSSYVWKELEPTQQTKLNRWIQSKQLTILRVDDNFTDQISAKELSISLSITDLSAWHLCDTKGDILLTSDGTLRKMAKKYGLKTHGLLWIFDQIVKHRYLTADQAISKLEIIFSQNIYYRSNQKLLKAFEDMKNRWE